MLTVVGFPRSGTNLLHRMLAHYTDGPGRTPWDGMGAHDHTQKIHWRYQWAETDQTVYIYRDPRDCALSGWDYVRRHFVTDLDLATFLIDYFTGNWELWPTGWREHIAFWTGQDIPYLSYEALCLARRGAFSALLRELGLPLAEGRVAHAIEQSYRFGEHVLDGRYGHRIGRWRRELPAYAQEYLDHYCGDVMRDLGYRL